MDKKVKTDHHFRCKEHISEISLYSQKVETAIKISGEDEQQSDIIKKELEEKSRKNDFLKNKEDEIKDKIASLKVELTDLSEKLEKGIDELEAVNKETLANLRGEMDSQQKTLHDLYNQLTTIRSESETEMTDFKEVEEMNYKLKQELQTMKETIVKIKEDTEREESRKRDCDSYIKLIQRKWRK